MFTFVPNEAARIAAVTRPTEADSPLVSVMLRIREETWHYPCACGVEVLVRDGILADTLGIYCSKACMDVHGDAVTEALSEWHVSPSRVGPNPFTSVDRAMPLPW